MIKNTNKVSNKQVLDVNVEQLYNKKGVKAFKVSIREGTFIVVDYIDRFSKEPDTEIYWERYIDIVRPNTSEYRAANSHVTTFLLQKKK